jgi:uncharacterized membrane protein YdjX (TVP38/TMEM64 family)
MSDLDKARQSAEPQPVKSSATQWIVKLIVLGIVVAAFVVLFVFFRDELSLQSLAERETQLRDFQQQHPVVVFAIAFVIYVVVTALSLPGATGMTLLYGWLFGFWPALVLVSFASTAGATAAFLLSRYLLGQSIQSRFGDRLEGFNRALEREGAFYLFTLRLIPAVPFFVINVVMGLTKMRVPTYWWVSQLGMLPGTCVYVYAGSSLPTLHQIAERGTGSILKVELLVALILLGIFPLAMKKIIGWLRPQAQSA